MRSLPAPPMQSSNLKAGELGAGAEPTELSGYFMEPQNFSVNDGDGIRTMLFFAGCPLACQWCANPEGLVKPNRVAYQPTSCIGCGHCTTICPAGIGIDLNAPGQRSSCTSCGRCVDVCPTHSRKQLVRRWSATEILDRLRRQLIFYRYSGGGVTFSGGEATLQPAILRYLVNDLYDQAVHLALETSGWFEFAEVRDILEKLDLIFIDIKLMDPNKHRYFTGISNETILANIKRLNELTAEVVVRIPLIDGVNADRENILATAQFVKTYLNNPTIELLPYHNFGDEKYEALGLSLPSRDFKTPDAAAINRLTELIKAQGVAVKNYL